TTSSAGRTGRASAARVKAEGCLDRADCRLQRGGKDDAGVLLQEAARVVQVVGFFLVLDLVLLDHDSSFASCSSAGTDEDGSLVCLSMQKQGALRGIHSAAF
ncbi:hypothetical protein EJB05_18858, partial [Eragrostis curvula]